MKVTLLLAVMLTIFAVTGPGWAADPIPLGTVITHSNWQQYKSYMTDDQQQMFLSTNKTCDVPPTAKILIGVTKHYLAPPSYWDATEKYSKQVKLVKVPDGSYTISGYVAGQPFPVLQASDPLAGYKLMYDIYFQYRPAVAVTDNMHTVDVDRYGNSSWINTLLTSYVLMHVTDPGYPRDIKTGVSGVYYASSVEQNAPEQIKYEGALTLTWDDPSRLPEAYVFLPSLRRALRLSSSARCAPFQGQDFANDDVTPTPLPPTWFSAKFLGLQEKINFLIPPDKDLKAAGQRSSFYPGGAQLFPKASVLGPWQVREEYAVALSRLPKYAPGYCYSKKVMYLDKEAAVTMGWDDWDENGKYWRGLEDLGPVFPQKDGGFYAWSSLLHDNCDFQNNHQSILFPPAAGRSAVWINQETPKQFLNYTRYATPAGLQEIMQ